MKFKIHHPTPSDGTHPDGIQDARPDPESLDCSALIKRLKHSIQRLRLGEYADATSGRQPPCEALMNSMSLDVYAGPTCLPLPGRGTMSSRISLRLERAARFTITCLEFSSSSGFRGIRALEIERNLETCSRSASNQAYTSRTATRKHSFGDLVGSQARHKSGAQSAS